MSANECLLLFAPLIAGCLLAAAFGIACRLHGGADTPTAPEILIACGARHLIWGLR